MVVNGDGTADIYRKLPLIESDYVPFDKGVTDRFHESMTIIIAASEEMKET
jgi:hypothetical protein